MTKTNKIVLLAVFLFVILPVVLIRSCSIRAGQYEQGFSQIYIGQQRETVERIMGNASEIKKCNPSAYDRTEFPNGDCFEVYGYFSVFHYWAIAFDKDGKVARKFYWTFEDGYGKPHEFDMLF